MKKWIALLAAVVCALACVPALAQMGFAEVCKDQVNFRRAPGGERIAFLDAPQSVYVFEEKQSGGRLWCHVYTHVGKNPTEGWIRADMLRFLSEEFTDIVSVQAGDRYVTGLRADGTVAIMGNDMPHLPCIETVRSWTGIRKVSSGRCEAYALDKDGNLLAVGRNSRFGAERAADYSADEPVLLDEDGLIMRETWEWDEDTVGQADMRMPDAIRGIPCKEVTAYEREIYGVLTEEGKMICVNGLEDKQHVFAHAPYVDVDAGHGHVVALRADGRVDAAERWSGSKERLDVSGWTDVIKVAAGTNHTLGLRADGTVYYAGDDGDHAWQVANWTNVKDIDAGDGYSIALRTDGSVVMAGVYDEGYFR